MGDVYDVAEMSSGDVLMATQCGLYRYFANGKKNNAAFSVLLDVFTLILSNNLILASNIESPL